MSRFLTTYQQSWSSSTIHVVILHNDVHAWVDLWTSLTVTFIIIQESSYMFQKSSHLSWFPNGAVLCYLMQSAAPTLHWFTWTQSSSIRLCRHSCCSCSVTKSLSFTMSQGMLKLWSIESVMPSNYLILSSPSPPAFNLSQYQGLFQWVGSLHQVAKVLEFQLQHQSFQWIFTVDFLQD